LPAWWAPHFQNRNPSFPSRRSFIIRLRLPGRTSSLVRAQMPSSVKAEISIPKDENKLLHSAYTSALCFSGPN
jgi:hypothetical protein